MQKKKMPIIFKIVIILFIIWLVCSFLLMSIFYLGYFSLFEGGYDRSSVDYIYFSPDSSKLMSITHENTIQIWDIYSGEEIGRKEIGDHGVGLWFPDGDKIGVNLYSKKNKGLAIYNTTNLNQIGMINAAFTYVYASKDFGIITTKIIDYSDIDRLKYNITLWNISTYFEMKQLNISLIYGVLGLSPGGDKIAFLPCDSDSLKVIDLANERYNLSLENMDYSVEKINSYFLLDLCWSSDDQKIALLTYFNSFKNPVYYYVWDSLNGSLLLNRTVHINDRVVDISPDCTKLIIHNSSDHGNISIRDIESGSIVISLLLSERRAASVAWSPDGSKVAAGSSDGIIKIWNPETGELIQTLKTAKDRRLPT